MVEAPRFVVVDLLASIAPILGGSWGFKTGTEAEGFPKLPKALEVDVAGATEEDVMLAVVVGLLALEKELVLCPSGIAAGPPLLATGLLLPSLPKILVLGAALGCG